ncbi:uncharacterized protein [Oryza sativa Japonica Group]|uniref:DUF1618 domain-containing protein n=1 Tax=Oryza sativa subsp. japonica TaxID=39947 RepID=A3BVA9_ORYSJ|nr:uncharacterized protein LOC107278098 [Oryza sativa Japonica Group]EAZ43498.1 hypothetical protein OsJ_28114 [Oryza sativa Japonica Group]KAF2920723.1 hypothetical protein DAI22_08g232900 [Oryza sativa Japonica Group]
MSTSRQSIDINGHRRQPILLDTNVLITDAMNDDTVATLTSSRGHTIKVSSWISQPPAISYLSFHCHYSSHPRYNNFDELDAKIVGAEGSFILLTALASPRGSERYDYLMYKLHGYGDNGESWSSSLEQVPLPHVYPLPVIEEFGIVPNGGKHFDLAALVVDYRSPMKCSYSMHIYSSKDTNWRVIPMVDPYPEVRKVIATKVITIAEGVLGWVDLDHGVMVCDLREDVPGLRYVPLPAPLPQNWYRLKEFLPGTLAKSFRDLVCVDGVMSFVEMEHRVIVTTEKPSDPSKMQVLYDTDLIVSYNLKDLNKKPQQLQRKDGWRIVSWSRHVSSNCWEKGCEVDAVDISGLSPNLAENLASPTLGVDDGDVVYMRSKASLGKGKMVAIDLRRKKVKAIGPYSFEKHDPFSLKAFSTCLLPPDDWRKRSKYK